mgnify:CR=1 FL=1
MVLMLIDESEVLDWRRKGFRIHKRFKSGGVQMVERDLAHHGYVWTHEDDEELKHIRRTFDHLSYDQISEFYIPERTAAALRHRASKLGVPRPIPARPDVDYDHAYQMYMDHPEMSLADVFAVCFPSMTYSKARYWFDKYMLEKKKAPTK